MIGWRSKPQAAGEEKPKGFDDFELRLGDVMRGERATLGKSLLDVQRELRIKATYIAAIENADVSAFETPGFVAGYVRSYARYLAMDPDWAFARFCKEANFTVAHGMSASAAPQRLAQARARTEFADPLANPNATFVPRGESLFSRIEPGAVGSVAVLLVLIGAIGYGGWSVLREVQRVQLSPVDEAPIVVAQIDPLAGAGTAPVQATGTAQLADGTAAPDLMDRLYRPQALDVPVMVSRDGPIAAIDPRNSGTIEPLTAMAGTDTTQDTVQVLADARPGVEVLAVRPAWVRVNSADGTVLFEKILDAGERYPVPDLETAAVFRTGNSGSVYFVVNGKTYGPAAPGANVAKDIALGAAALVEKFAEADIATDSALAQVMTAEASGVVTGTVDAALE